MRSHTCPQNQKLNKLADKALGRQEVEVEVPCEIILFENFRKNASNNGSHSYLTSTDRVEHNYLAAKTHKSKPKVKVLTL